MLAKTTKLNSRFGKRVSSILKLRRDDRSFQVCDTFDNEKMNLSMISLLLGLEEWGTKYIPVAILCSSRTGYGGQNCRECTVWSIGILYLTYCSCEAYIVSYIAFSAGKRRQKCRRCQNQRQVVSTRLHLHLSFFVDVSRVDWTTGHTFSRIWRPKRIERGCQCPIRPKFEAIRR